MTSTGSDLPGNRQQQALLQAIVADHAGGECILAVLAFGSLGRHPVPVACHAA